MTATPAPPLQLAAAPAGPGTGDAAVCPPGEGRGHTALSSPPRAPGAVTGSGEKQPQEQRRPHAGVRWFRAPGLRLTCCAPPRLGAAEPGPPRRGAGGERRPRPDPPRVRDPAVGAAAGGQAGQPSGWCEMRWVGGHPAAAVRRAAGEPLGPEPGSAGTLQKRFGRGCARCLLIHSTLQYPEQSCDCAPLGAYLGKGQ